MTGVAAKNKMRIFHGIRIAAAIPLLLVILPLLIYGPVKTYEFINFDDDNYISENPHVRMGLTVSGFRWALTATRSMNWHPITWLSHMMDCHLYGLNSGAHHLTNLLFHILNTLLLFRVLRRMTGCLWKSGLVAALFALHPINVESVAWVSQRKTVLSTFFWFLTLWSYTRYAERPSPVRYGIVLLLYGLGLMAKPMLVTVPFLLLLLDYWPLARIRAGMTAEGNLHRLVFEKIPLSALAAISGTITYMLQQSGGATSPLAAIPISVRISNAVISFAGYIGKLLLPHPLAVLYPHPRTFQGTEFIAALLFLCLTSVYAWRVRFHKPYWIVGWFWYLGTLAPVIGIVQVGLQSMANRYAYVPAIGLFILGIWDLADRFSRWRLQTLVSAAIPAGLLIALGLGTAYQVRFWSDGINLYQSTLRVTKNNYAIHHNLGCALARVGRYSEARFHFKEALRIEPTLQVAERSLISLPAADEADVSRLMKEIQADPTPEAHVRFGNLYKRNGSLQKALDHYHRALEKQIDYLPAIKQVGIIYAMMGNYPEAEKAFHKLAGFEQGCPDAHYLLAGVYARKKMAEHAIDWLARAGSCSSFDWNRILMDPNLDAIRNTKPFADFLKKLAPDDRIP